tara:strand:- start:1622 stop:2095 length:474 start_codon:yes stop_codon:yes gene_type:complete
MIEEIRAFFSPQMIYLWLNFGVLPFWFVLIFFPQSRICNYLVTSIFPIFLLSVIYLYLFYYHFMNNYNYLGNFNLYLGLDNLKSLFLNETFLLMFWIHFLGVNLFCGCYIVKDSQKFSLSKYLIFSPLVITYFIGPLGILIYWIIRIISAKRFNIID